MTSVIEKDVGLFSSLLIIHDHLRFEFLEKGFKPLKVKIRMNLDLSHAGSEFFETFFYVQDVFFDLIKVWELFVTRPFS